MKGAGKRLSTKHLSARVASSLLPYCRVGVVVGKRGHSAVERNRLRRRLRELSRIHVIPHFSGLDVVLYARSNAYEIGFSQLAEETISIKDRLTSVVQ